MEKITSDLQERTESIEMDKLERLRKALSAGTYVVKTEAVAQRLIEYMLQLSLPDEALPGCCPDSQEEKDRDEATRDMSDRPAQTG